MPVQKVLNNGHLLYSLDIFRFQIKYSRCRKYQTMAFQKVSDNGLLLYGLDTVRFQISIHTLKLDVPRKYSDFRKYQTMAFEKKQKMAFCHMVQIFLDSQYLFIHLNRMCQKSTPVGKNIRQWPWRKCQTMAFCYMV